MKLSDVTTEAPVNKKRIKAIEQKNQSYKRFIQSNETVIYINQFKVLQDELGFRIEKSKNNYSNLSQKLSNKATSSKTYWPILKTSINDKKILYIPPAIHDNNFTIDFKEKAALLIHFLLSNIHCQGIVLCYQKICYFLLKNV